MSANYVEEFTRDVAIDPRTTALLVIDTDTCSDEIIAELNRQAAPRAPAG
jgi:hypothetical protein